MVTVHWIVKLSVGPSGNPVNDCIANTLSSPAVAVPACSAASVIVAPTLLNTVVIRVSAQRGR